MVRVSAADGIVVELEDYEGDLLRQLAGEMKMLLEADLPRADPVTARIFPDAYDDAEMSDEYRKLVGDELRSDKLRNLDALISALRELEGPELRLGEEEAESWLALLTDMRLAIGTRLEVTEEKMGEELAPDSPDAAAFAVLHWLGWLQESMIAAVTKEGG